MNLSDLRLTQLTALLAVAFAVVGCADTMSDDSSSEDEYAELGETETKEGTKADNIDGRSITWKNTERAWIDGTAHTGTAEVVSTNPKVQIVTGGINLRINEYPVTIDIESAGGFLNTEEMNFALYAKGPSDEELEQLDFVDRYQDDECTCDGFLCNRMGGPPEKCMEMRTYEDRYWRYSEMTIEQDKIKFGDETFANPFEGQTDVILQIIPLPYGQMGDLEGTYEYELTVECFGTSCGTNPSNTGG